MKLLLISILAAWSIFGVFFYWSMLDKTVRKTPQKIVMLFISGPIVLGIMPFIVIMDFVAEKMFAPLYRWLQE